MVNIDDLGHFRGFTHFAVLFGLLFDGDDILERLHLHLEAAAKLRHFSRLALLPKIDHNGSLARLPIK